MGREKFGVVLDPTAWRARRPPSDVLHLDNAAAGRQSVATLDAVARHARLESTIGAYVAQEAVLETVEQLRADLAGLLGTSAECVAFVESATAAGRAVLDAWPLPVGAHIGIVAGEWGPNVDAFERRGLTPVELAADPDGTLNLEELERRLAHDPPAVVHLTQVSSHRALVQPVGEAARLCRDAGVPLWVDAAQAVGHVDARSVADVVYGTSRKWLAGPRGVGFVAVAERSWDHLDPPRPAMAGDLLPPRYLESAEAHVAGRVGLATAVRELLTDGPATVRERLGEVGRRTRAVLADVPGWTVVDAADAPGAITALRPTAGQDVVAERRRLLADHRILTTAATTARAPRDMAVPLLRISPQVDCTEADLERLAGALATRAGDRTPSPASTLSDG